MSKSKIEELAIHYGTTHHMVKNFFVNHKIRCAEDIYQRDTVIVNAYEFLEMLGEHVGYYNGEDSPIEEDDE